MKRTLSFILALVLLLSLPCVGLAEEHEHSGPLRSVILTTAYGIPCCGQYTCSECGSIYYDTIEPEDIGMPIVNIEIDVPISTVTKENKVDVTISYRAADQSFESAATLKLQGGTSVRFPKKNYNVQLLKDDGSKNKVTLADDWGKQSKYCLKANYVDYSQSRNIVSGRIFNDIVHSRGIDDEINALKNGAVVDGFPVLVYVNGGYHGLYTLNIPKDKWMFGMKDETLRQAALFGSTWTRSVQLFEPIGNLESSGWEIEYCSTEDDPAVGTGWAIDSMNEFIRFLNRNNGEAFKAGIGHYTDVDRAIDVLIYTYFIHAEDNLSKNMAWLSYDGVKWIPSVYDMDGTWGLAWNGTDAVKADDLMPGAGNLLFQRLLDNYPDEIRARYVELRSGILSVDNVMDEFYAFACGIPQTVRNTENMRWPSVPRRTDNNVFTIESYLRDRAAAMDAWFGVDIPEGSTYDKLCDMSADTLNRRIEQTKPLLPFTDAKNHWALDGIAFCYRMGLMKGVTDKLFSPEVTLNRGMVVTVLHRLVGAPASETPLKFSDVAADSYCAEAVKWASENGIVQGFADGSFRQTQEITREQLAAILYRFAKYKGLDTSKMTDITGFADYGSVGSFAVDALSWANAMGYVKGTTATTLNPKGGATRAQFAVIMSRFCASLTE